MPGGVCQVLDYEVELMADYVSEMATRIVMPRATVNAAFRKFVSQILTSTRLPSTTILLGMNYLAKRVNMMTAAGQTNHTEGQIWRMLTISLLLGSKFLDDNTFQNKSWSEVSGIPVQELNTLEYEWLGAIGWCLYVNMDESKDYNAWLKNWKDWLDNKKRQQTQTTVSRERAAAMVPPIETDATRLRAYSNWHQQQIAEYERLSSRKRNQHQGPYQREQQGPWMYPVQWHAPMTPPDSGYGTPEYPNSAASLNAQYNDWFDRAISHSASSAPRQFQQPTSFAPFHHNAHQQRNHQANYPPFYNYCQSIWDHPNVSDCACVNCVGFAHQKQQPYFAAHAYGQPVVG
jgi:hypothetical protein